jgi:hypothetical protein
MRASVVGRYQPRLPISGSQDVSSVPGARCEVVELALPADSVVLDSAYHMPIAAVVLVKREDER